MCIFAKAVDRVSETKILYALLSGKQSRWVVTAYSNAVQLAKGTASTTMLLPVPALHTSVVLLNLKGDKTVENMLQCLHEMFQAEMPKPRIRDRDRCAGSPEGRKLAVISSGSYSVSLVPDHASLHRLDADTFEVSAELSETLQHYKDGFSFLAFKLRASTPFHPFTYAYPLRDDCRTGFIPTRHFHPLHHVAATSSSSSSAASSAAAMQVVEPASNPAVTDDWDHEIYVLGVDAKSFADVRPKRRRLAASTKVRVLAPLLRFIAKAASELPASDSDSSDLHTSSSAASALQSLVSAAVGSLTRKEPSASSAASASTASTSAAMNVTASSALPIRDIATQYVIHGSHRNVDAIFDLSNFSGVSSASGSVADSPVVEDDALGKKRKSEVRVDVGEVYVKKVQNSKESEP